jgi:hypothetical protein
MQRVLCPDYFLVLSVRGPLTLLDSTSDPPLAQLLRTSCYTDGYVTEIVFMITFQYPKGRRSSAHHRRRRL